MKTTSTLTALLTALALPASAAVLTYNYDAAGRLTGVNYGGTSNTAYTYNAGGSLLSRISTLAPLPPLAAGYTGLITNVTPSATNTGTITLKVLPSGAFSGKLLLGGTSFPIKGTFATDGTTPDLTLSRKAPLTSLTLHLVLDVTGGTNRITGNLTDGTFTSALVLDRAAYDKKANPLPTGLVGAYTMLFQSTEVSATVPQGTGYGTVKVDAAGVVKLTASLADGTKLTQSAILSSAGTWPLFLSLYKGAGQLSGEVTFDTDPGNSDFSGTLDWVKPATTSALYPAAFSTDLAALGSAYTPPAKGQRVLDLASLTPNALLDTGLFTSNLTLDTNNKFTAEANDTHKPTLKLTPAGGLVTGSFLDGTTKRTVQGVIFQTANSAEGYYLDSNSSEVYSLTPAP